MAEYKEYKCELCCYTVAANFKTSKPEQYADNLSHVPNLLDI